jgi:hypothetical protein
MFVSIYGSSTHMTKHKILKFFCGFLTRALWYKMLHQLDTPIVGWCPCRQKRRYKGLIPRRFFSAKWELFRLFLLNCDYSNKLFLLDCSQFKRNMRNISHFAEKKRPWNQAISSLLLFLNIDILISWNRKLESLDLASFESNYLRPCIRVTSVFTYYGGKNYPYQKHNYFES